MPTDKEVRDFTRTVKRRLNYLEKNFEQSYEIAVFFAGQGIRGKHRHPMSCPLYHYLAKDLDNYPFFNVGLRRIAIETNKLHTWKTLEVPEIVRNFLDDFDSGRYPYLLLEEEETENAPRTD